MASPQRENGHIDVANKIAEVLAQTQLSGYESRVLWAIFRKTYGWHKKTDRISYTQFEKMTGLDRRHIVRTVRKLTERNMITIAKNGNRKPLTIGFQKNYEKWLLPKMAIDNYCQNRQHPIAKNGNKSIAKNGNHKRKKETIKRKGQIFTKKAQKEFFKKKAKEIYESYPIDKRKPQAIRNIIKLISESPNKLNPKLLPCPVAILKMCVENYKAEVERKGIEESFIKYPSNFFGKDIIWEDYLVSKLVMVSTPKEINIEEATR